MNTISGVEFARFAARENEFLLRVSISSWKQPLTFYDSTIATCCVDWRGAVEAPGRSVLWSSRSMSSRAFSGTHSCSAQASRR
jgi:hypothetical protein